MKKLVFLFTIVISCVSISGQGVRLPDPPGAVLTAAEKIALGTAQNRSFNEAISNPTISFKVSSHNFNVSELRTTCNIYVEPGLLMFQSKFYDYVRAAFVKMLRHTTDAQTQRFFDPVKPPIEIYFLSGKGPNLSGSNVWTWDPSDFPAIGVLATNYGPDGARVRRIVIANRTTRDFARQGEEFYDPTSQLLHGLGHLLHEEWLGEYAYWNERSHYNHDMLARRPFPSPFNQEPLARTLSNRAMWSRSEFVAELFMYTSLDKDTEKIRNEDRNNFSVQYRYYWGPGLKAFNE
ncbi:MAG: hypothetical protein H7Y01_12915 [Ferruginibacter sp.]|nr:hypothetical protein [Chitinophagaceae bacterium]